MEKNYLFVLGRKYDEEQKKDPARTPEKLLLFVMNGILIFCNENNAMKMSCYEMNEEMRSFSFSQFNLLLICYLV